MKFNRENLQRFGVGLMLLSPLSAFAAVPDTTAIEASISDGQAGAIKVAIAFTVAVLAVRAVKLMRRG